jgi:Mrp family chromosome partitioning ATPase
LEFHIYASYSPGITIMPVGYPEADADGPPIVSPVHVGVLVLRAIDDYDMVLLDCPPLLPVADTHIIGEVVDKALLVVRAGSTPRDMLDQAIDEFGREKFLGAVLNRAKPADIPYFREVYGYYRRDSARG